MGKTPSKRNGSTPKSRESRPEDGAPVPGPSPPVRRNSGNPPDVIPPEFDARCGHAGNFFARSGMPAGVAVRSTPRSGWWPDGQPRSAEA